VQVVYLCIELPDTLECTQICMCVHQFRRAHICYLCDSLSKNVFIIKSVKNIFSSHVLWNIYFAYFHSRLRYGIILWGGAKESVKVLQIQKKVIRLITGLKRLESCRQKFKYNRILTVTSMYILEVL